MKNSAFQYIETRYTARLLEGNAQAVTKSAERLSTTAEQTGKGIQETFSTVVTKMKEVYAA